MIILAFLCGLILGYLILIRPSFGPPIILFYCGILIEILGNKKNWKKILTKLLIIAVGSSVLILPVMRNIWNADHSIGIQYSEFFKTSKINTLRVGLAGVRIIWSMYNPSQNPLPGIYDPQLKKMYYDQCTILSSKDWINCLFSKPLFIPIYLWKKTLALFDAPNLQPYATDFTPKWFVPLERIFGMLGFCGFISFLIILISNFFKRNKITLITWPIILFTISFTMLHSVGHIEGRYVFTVIPFLILMLFLGFHIAKRSKKSFFIVWTYTMIISGISFLIQTYIWDYVRPI